MEQSDKDEEQGRDGNLRGLLRQGRGKRRTTSAGDKQDKAARRDGCGRTGAGGWRRAEGRRRITDWEASGQQGWHTRLMEVPTRRRRSGNVNGEGRAASAVAGADAWPEAVRCRWAWACSGGAAVGQR